MVAPENIELFERFTVLPAEGTEARVCKGRAVP